MGVRKNSFVVNSIISHFPVKWEVFLLNFFKRQSCYRPYYVLFLPVSTDGLSSLLCAFPARVNGWLMALTMSFSCPCQRMAYGPYPSVSTSR